MTSLYYRKGTSPAVQAQIERVAKRMLDHKRRVRIKHGITDEEHGARHNLTGDAEVDRAARLNLGARDCPWKDCEGDPDYDFWGAGR